MRAFNKKKKPKHTTKVRYYELTYRVLLEDNSEEIRTVWEGGNRITKRQALTESVQMCYNTYYENGVKCR